MTTPIPGDGTTLAALLADMSTTCPYDPTPDVRVALLAAWPVWQQQVDAARGNYSLARQAGLVNTAWEASDDYATLVAQQPLWLGQPPRAVGCPRCRWTGIILTPAAAPLVALILGPLVDEVNRRQDHRGPDT